MTKEELSGKPTRQLLAAAESQPQSIDESQHRIEAALKGVTRDLNTRPSRGSEGVAGPPRHHNEGLPHFVRMSRDLGSALIENAQQQVTRAQNNLEEIKQWAEAMQQEAQHKWEEMQELERRFEDYRGYLLQANDRFNGGKQ